VKPVKRIDWLRRLRFLSFAVPLALGPAAALAVPIRLTMNPGDDTAPHWQSSGNQIAYQRFSGSFRVPGIVHSDATNEHVLTSSFNLQNNDDVMAWVGQHLLFGDINSFHEIWDYNTTTNQVQALLTFAGGQTHVGSVAATSTGSTVMWRVGRNDNTNSHFRVEPYSALTNFPPHSADLTGDLVWAENNSSVGVRGVSLTPDGRRAVISRPTGALGGFDLFMIDTDPSDGLSSTALQLTNTGQTLGWLNMFPEVSRAGGQILYSQAVPGQFWDVMRIGIGGGTIVNITNTPTVHELSPTWSPDGLSYAFQRFDTGIPGQADNWNIYRDLIAGSTGSTQNDPIVPTVIPNGGPWVFGAVPGSGGWFDPPLASGYVYQTDGLSNFVQVGLPVGIAGQDEFYTISDGINPDVVIDVSVNQFYTFPSPVSSFTVTGIDPPYVDGGDPQAFPTYLNFAQSLVTFTMTPIPVPEPAVAILAAAGLLALLRSRRR
jgi:Tol biopolymer transport system component